MQNPNANFNGPWEDWRFKIWSCHAVLCIYQMNQVTQPAKLHSHAFCNISNYLVNITDVKPTFLNKCLLTITVSDVENSIMSVLNFSHVNF